MRLLVQNCASDVGDLLGAEVGDQLQGGASIRHVVGDEHPGARDVDGVKKRRSMTGKSRRWSTPV